MRNVGERAQALYNQWADAFSTALENSSSGQTDVDSDVQNQARESKAYKKYYAPDIDSYDEKTYNKRGWTYVNEVLFGRMGPDLNSKYMAKETNDYVEVMPDGTVAISTGAKESVNNTIVFVKGSQADPTITEIVTISRSTETTIQPYRDDLIDYLKDGHSYDSAVELLETYAGEEIFNRYTLADFDSFSELKRSKQSHSRDNFNNQKRNTGERNGRGGSENADSKSFNVDPDTQAQARRVTKEQDTAYMDAVNRGDTETARRERTDI